MLWMSKWYNIQWNLLWDMNKMHKITPNLVKTHTHTCTHAHTHTRRHTHTYFNSLYFPLPATVGFGEEGPGRRAPMEGHSLVWVCVCVRQEVAYAYVNCEHVFVCRYGCRSFFLCFTTTSTSSSASAAFNWDRCGGRRCW